MTSLRSTPLPSWVALTMRPTVHVWQMALDNMDDAARRTQLAYLRPDEIEQWRRFVAPSAADQFAAARALLRTRLSTYVDVPPTGWIFRRNAYGRPHIDPAGPFEDLHFNVSHTDGLVVCAVTHGRSVGIDVENTTRDLDFLDMSKTFFSRLEAASLLAREPAAVRSTFYSYWTLKESYIKARGLGLSVPLDSFWFDLSVVPPTMACAPSCGDHGARWQFHQWTAGKQHAVALAIDTAEPVDIQTYMVPPGLQDYRSAGHFA